MWSLQGARMTDTRKAQKILYNMTHRPEARARAIVYRATHLESIKAHKALYYAEHREEQRARMRARYLLNGDEHRSHSAAWRAEHPEEVKEYQKVYHVTHKEELAVYEATYRITHQDEIRKRDAEYKKTHADRVQVYGAKRRAAKYGNTPIEELLTSTEWLAILADAHGHCHYCSKEAKLTLDHVIPLSKGGKHSKDNVVAACLHCNASKKDTMLDEWKERDATPTTERTV
jgi:5-methylcytosine-specific restriction endonuclease McrA